MRVFKTPAFARSLRRSRLRESQLCEAVDEMARGLIDADLGGGIVKKRVALPGAGKSGGTRMLVATNKDDRWFFLFGFRKNERSSITKTELEALKTLGSEFLKRSGAELDSMVKARVLEEICNGK